MTAVDPRPYDLTTPTGVAERPAGQTSRRRPTPALVRGCRPRQMCKNVLVLMAPALSGRVLEPDVLTGAAVAFTTFCAVSAAVYLCNDVRDVEADRHHPTKRTRPVASGALPAATAVRAAGALVVVALGLAVLWSGELAIVLAGYLTIQVAYTAGLKHRSGIDLVVVASGFVLRVVAGGVAAGVELSLPFVAVVAFASLFMVAGKRYSELVSLGPAAATRPALLGYSMPWLRGTWMVSAVLAVLGYAVAAAALAPFGSAAAACALASVPAFAGGILRYASHVRAADAGCPEAVVFGDKRLQLLGVLTCASVVAALVLG